MVNVDAIYKTIYIRLVVEYHLIQREDRELIRRSGFVAAVFRTTRTGASDLRPGPKPRPSNTHVDRESDL